MKGIVLFLMIGWSLSLSAQYKILKHFAKTNQEIEYDNAPLSNDEDTIYGTLPYDDHYGTLYKTHKDGTGFKTIYQFKYDTNGFNPISQPILTDSLIYGITATNASGNAVFYSVGKNGNLYQKLHEFNNTSDKIGINPSQHLTLYNNSIYGYTHGDKENDKASVLFCYSLDSQEIVSLCDVSSLALTSNLEIADSIVYFSGHEKIYTYNLKHQTLDSLTTDRIESLRNPISWLSLMDSMLIGYSNRQPGLGIEYDEFDVLFSINRDGTDFKILQEFNPYIGIFPSGKPIIIGKKIYGMTSVGGPNVDINDGTIFCFDINKSQFELLFYFFGFPEASGIFPSGGLLQIDDKLYGTTMQSQETGSKLFETGIQKEKGPGNIRISNITHNSIRVNWDKGEMRNSALLLTATSNDYLQEKTPLLIDDTLTLIQNPNNSQWCGTEDTLIIDSNVQYWGSTNCVYKGIDSSVVIKGLPASTQFMLEVVGYRDFNAKNRYWYYRADSSVTNPIVFKTLHDSISNNLTNLKLEPSIGYNTINREIIIVDNISLSPVKVYNSYGQMILKRSCSAIKESIPAFNLLPGVYFVKIDGAVGHKIIVN